MKIKTYLIELSLVVMGVLIALSVDNIREDINSDKSVKALLKVIKKDLQFDIDTLSMQLKQDSIIISNFRNLLSALESSEYERINTYFYSLYYNSDYEMRAGGYKMLTNSNLFTHVELGLMTNITNYYETSLNDLKSWSRKDDLMASKMVDFLIKNHEGLAITVKENKHILSELKHLVIAKELLLSQEMSKKTY
jgi:hypothetical protein